MRRLNTFYMRSICCILGITRQYKVTNADVLSRAGLPCMFNFLEQSRLHWLGHIHQMEDGRIPKEMLYRELTSGKRSTVRPQLRYSDVVKRDR